MRVIDWLRKLSSGASERLPAGSYIHLLTEEGNEGGVILVHSDETRDVLIREFAQFTADVTPHRGTISPYFVDLLGSASGLINAAIQSGQLLQIVGTPQILAGIREGSFSIMRSAGQMTGTVVSNDTLKIVGQLRFEPANVAGIVGPLFAWQILNAVAGVYHLQRIDTKLEALQRGLDRLEFRLQAKTYGQLMSAINTLQELSEQRAVTGTFTPDMTIKLALAERDIRSTLVEQQLLMRRFDDISNKIREVTGGRGADAANQFLKEEADEFLMDAKLLTVASRASILVSEAWIQHDLEHNPRHVSMRLRDLEREMNAIRNTVSPLEKLKKLQEHAMVNRPDGFVAVLSEKLKDLQEHATKCLAEMDRFSKNIFNRQVAGEIESPETRSESEEVQQNTGIPSVLIWKDHNNVKKSVVIDVAVEK